MPVRQSGPDHRAFTGPDRVVGAGQVVLSGRAFFCQGYTGRAAGGVMAGRVVSSSAGP
ncbi:hypothetical protein RKD29_002477 [Streptomyces tendae]